MRLRKDFYDHLKQTPVVYDPCFIFYCLAESLEEIPGTGHFNLRLYYPSGTLDWFVLESFFLALSQNHRKKTILSVELPSPSAHPLYSHIAALAFDHDRNGIDYHDPHGILMPRPLFDALRSNFPAYTITNHRIVQQLDGELSCAVYSIANAISFAKGRGPVPVLGAAHYRNEQRPLLERYIGLCEQKNAVGWIKRILEKVTIGATGQNLAEIPPSARDRAVKNFWAHDFPHEAAREIPTKQKPATIHPPLLQAPYRPGRSNQPTPFSNAEIM